MKIITSPTVKPPPHPFYGEYDERGKSPWHKSAFPEEFAHAAPEQGEVPLVGWYLNDAYRNQIGFVPDGTVFEVPATPPVSGKDKEGESA